MMGRDEFNEGLHLHRINTYLILDSLDIDFVFWCSVHHGFGASPICPINADDCKIRQVNVKVAKRLVLSDLQSYIDVAEGAQR